MDFRRHVTAGRLSELVGKNDTALQADEVVRTLGWRRVAEQELAQADPATRRYLDDYARGVNDYIGKQVALASCRSTTPSSASTTPLSADRALDGAGLRHLVQGDGLGPAGQLRRRALPRPHPRHGQGRRPGRAALPGRTPTASTSRSSPQGRTRRGRRASAPRRPATATRCRRRAATHASTRTSSSTRTSAKPDPDGLVAALLSAPVQQTAGRRAAGGRRRPGPARRRRRRQRDRLELLGGRRAAHDDRQADARQRPAPRARHPGHLVPDGPALPDADPDDLPVRRRRLHLLRRPRGDHRPHPADRLGDDQPRPGRHGLLPGEAGRRPLSARRPVRPAADPAGDRSRSRGRRP